MNIHGVFGTKRFVSSGKTVCSVKSIIEKVCEFYRLEKKDLLSERRTSDVLKPRQVAMFLACELLPSKTISSISKVFGRDRTTVLWSRDRISMRIQTDGGLAAECDALKRMIGSV